MNIERLRMRFATSDVVCNFFGLGFCFVFTFWIEVMSLTIIFAMVSGYVFAL